ncbi:MAG: virulence-associated protein E, partial [Clostridia bacterium]|nr:virulence-associated protein E [Clostridia bacterium]
MNDRTLTISVGGSRKSVRWAATEIQWPALCDRLRTPIRGKESHDAYLRMPKAQQDNLKDIGGFVGGALRGGRRKAANVTGRDLVTLDLDAIKKGATNDVLAAVNALGCASAVYSTRKHEPARPRLRVILPLDRTVTAEEYEPVTRRVAEWLGIEQADPTTFESWRLMYWPSCSADSEYIFDVNEGEFLSADGVLKTYRDWRDMRDWPQVPGQVARQRDLAAKQEDPEQKGGIVGAFCRTYSIRRVMDELIPGVYTPTDDPDRFTYAGGSTSGGAILYEEKWLYSHHATDPCSGRLVNAWDLARLHMFGDRDADAREGTPVNKLPSYESMRELAMGDDGIKRLLLDEQRAQITEDFGTANPDGDWRLQLEMDAKGHVRGSLVNMRLIFDNDPALQGIGRDFFLGNNYVYSPLPWNKSDE